MPLFRSLLPLRAALALTQGGERGLSLRELARALEVRDSSVQHALQVLREEGVVRTAEGARPRYRLGPGEGPRDVVRLAGRHLPVHAALAALTRANRAVELAAYRPDATTLYAVYGEAAEPEDELLLSEGLAMLLPLRLIAARHDLFIEETLRDVSLRERVLRARILKGNIARSLPDRTRQGDFRRARRLGTAHPSLRRIPARRLADLARRYSLRGLGLFGSAVRQDFRPDSDVDVLVRYAAGARPSLDDRISLEHELERLLERDVDVIDAAELRQELRPMIEADEVRLYGRRPSRMSANS